MLLSPPPSISVLQLIDFLIFAVAVAISLFDTATLLWLGLTVLFTGNRRKPATVAGSAGLLLGAIFFAGHTLIITHTYNLQSGSINLVWRVMWVVAVAAPYFWGLAIFYYSGDPAAGRWVRRILTAAGLALIITLFIVNPLQGARDDDEGFWDNLLSTHPPLSRRIARLQALLNEAPVAVPPTPEVSRG